MIVFVNWAAYKLESRNFNCTKFAWKKQVETVSALLLQFYIVFSEFLSDF
jgi:hypothetical protein